METAIPGARFPLDSAYDPDVGDNSIQGYSLKPTDNFILKHETRSDGNKYIEMMLQSPVDREKTEELSLTLTANDGGNPSKSGVMKINIKVIDVNDNAPVFTKKVYRASVAENPPKGSPVITLHATDADKGVNGEVIYAFRHVSESERGLFEIDEKSGEVTVAGDIDYEKAKKYEINIEAKDNGGYTDSCVLIIDIVDVNDNLPVISLTSFSNVVSEDAPVGTTVAVINVKDLDSAENGQVRCKINRNIPFSIKSSLKNYYTILTEETLDRELLSEYNITITATDEGSPPLSTNKTIQLRIADINDNRPVFEQTNYLSHITENNSPGMSIFTVRATDADCCQNSRVSYILDETQINGAPASSLVSINAETGVIYAVRSFDYEQLRQFRIHVRAQDGGSPPLSGNATVQIRIQDQNDNAPQVLYPVQTGSSLVAEMVPRSADVGYLVTKVVAVDVDSGQNSWLSYKLPKALERPLFEVGVHNGEIRTVRQVIDKDAVKQKLTVVVEDNGHPSRSSTVNVNLAVADSFPEVLSEFTDFTHKDYNGDLTFYLVLALAVVSFLFITCLVAIISVKIYRWRQSRVLYHSNLPVIPYYPSHYADTTGTGTLKQVYNYEVCMTTDSRKSDLKGIRPGSQSVIGFDPSGTLTLPHVQRREDSEEFPPQHVYNYEVCGTTDSRMSDVKRIRPYSQNTLVSLSRPGTVQREKMQQQDADFSTEHVYNYEVCGTMDSRMSDVKPRPYSQNTLVSLSRPGTVQRQKLDAELSLEHVYNYEFCGTTDSRRSDVKPMRPYSQNTLVSLSRPGTVLREKKEPLDSELSLEQKPPNNDWRLPPNQRPGPSGQHRFHTIQQRWTPYEKSRAGPLPEGAGVVAGTGPWPQPPTEAEQLQALMAGANAVNEATATLGPRYNAQYVPDYRQNVYIPGSTATLTANPQQQQQPQQALPPPAAMPPVDVPKAAQTPASKKKSTKKDKK
ncbi:protocadherin gamma-A12-like isoform X15 [Alosa sapidissima]|uniref:protocadherin gamma-A12-like isoform X15 n=1 Tax=Alosa sapidissima TaxID=34773 RepID=UPI001C0944BF|nr:protocadherin gamma-A12-like isoform X15 [Alosa sapidissima]